MLTADWVPIRRRFTAAHRFAVSCTTAAAEEVTARIAQLQAARRLLNIQKAMAALRANIPVVIIPKDNQRELARFPKYLCDKVTFIPVESIEDALQAALV